MPAFSRPMVAQSALFKINGVVSIQFMIAFTAVVSVSLAFFVKFYFISKMENTTIMSVFENYRNYNMLDPTPLSSERAPLSTPVTLGKPSPITTTKIKTTNDLSGALILAPMISNASNIVFSPTISILEKNANFIPAANEAYYIALESALLKCIKMHKAGDKSCNNNLPKMNKIIQDQLQK